MTMYHWKAIAAGLVLGMTAFIIAMMFELYGLAMAAMLTTFVVLAMYLMGKAHMPRKERLP